MPIEIDKILITDPQSIGQFMAASGQGCYIPAYQRPYSWDEKNISRLFEDVLRGIRQIISRPDTISFIGTIIAINDTEYQTIQPIYRARLSRPVMTIIDGQQRICTILISNIVMHDYIRLTVKRLAGKTGDHFDWIREKCTKLLADLRNTYLIDRIDRNHNYRYYPRIIRAYLDAWSYIQNEAKYESPIAKLIWEYIDFTESGNTTQFKLNLGDNNRYKTVDKAFRFIRKEIKRICQSSSDEFVFPPIQESFEGIQDFPLPDAAKKYVEEASDDKHYQYFCHLLRSLIFAHYLNHHIATTVVIAKKEDDAIDIFEALNTTGEPLTAFETLKTKVIERETLENYEGTESHKHITEIDGYIDRYNKAEKKQKVTSEMLVHFALFETGSRLQKTLTHQRRYLHDEFDKRSKLNNIDKNRSFVHSLAVVASFLDRLWDVKKDAKPDFTSFNIDDEEVLVGFEVLRELKHSITIAPLSRFYQQVLETEQETDRIQKIEDFVAAIKATVAFSVLWRGAKGTTHNIDSHYRDIMSSGIHHGNEHVPPLARQPNSGSEIISISNYQRALQLVLQHEGKIADKEDWIKQASTTPIYQYSKVITRFLIFCASEDTIANETEKGLVKLGRPGINPMLTLNRWNDKAYFTVEHVAPQSRNANWGDDIYNDIYNDSRNVNTLGNLTLLPQEENNAIGNKSWTHKKLMYSLLSAKTQEEFDNLQTQLPNVGLNLRKSANEVLTNAKYLGLCKSVALYDKDWSLCLIEKRTRCLVDLAWDRLEKWLFS